MSCDSCAEGDDDDFIAPEDDAQVNNQLGKHKNGRSETQSRSIKDWPDSCSETSQDMGKVEKDTKTLNQRAAEPSSIQHAHGSAGDSGASSPVC